MSPQCTSYCSTWGIPSKSSSAIYLGNCLSETDREFCTKRMWEHYMERAWKKKGQRNEAEQAMEVEFERLKRDVLRQIAEGKIPVLPSTLVPLPAQAPSTPDGRLGIPSSSLGQASSSQPASTSPAYPSSAHLSSGLSASESQPSSSQQPVTPQMPSDQPTTIVKSSSSDEPTFTGDHRLSKAPGQQCAESGRPRTFSEALDSLQVITPTKSKRGGLLATCM